jgi:hypothetical protein
MILLAGIVTALTIVNTGDRGRPELGPVPVPVAPPTAGASAPADAVPHTQLNASGPVGRSGGPGSRTRGTGPVTETGGQVQTVKFGFDDGTAQTWGPFWNGNNITSTVTRQTVYGGGYALRMQANTHYDRPPAIGTTHIDGLSVGAKVTFHLWYGGQGSGAVLPFVQDGAGVVRWAPQTFALPVSTGWHTFTWTVPGTTPHAIGIQFNTVDTADVVIALDSVNWS